MHPLKKEDEQKKRARAHVASHYEFPRNSKRKKDAVPTATVLRKKRASQLASRREDSIRLVFEKRTVAREKAAAAAETPQRRYKTKFSRPPPYSFSLFFLAHRAAAPHRAALMNNSPSRLHVRAQTGTGENFISTLRRANGPASFGRRRP